MCCKQALSEFSSRATDPGHDRKVWSLKERSHGSWMTALSAAGSMQSRRSQRRRNKEPTASGTPYSGVISPSNRYADLLCVMRPRSAC